MLEVAGFAVPANDHPSPTFLYDFGRLFDNFDNLFQGSDIIFSVLTALQF